MQPQAGAVVQYRSEERFAFCSTAKPLIVACALSRGLLAEQMAITEADLVPNSPFSSGRLGDQATVEQLSAAAIIHSDNTATNLLLRSIGGPQALTRFLRNLGDAISQLDHVEPALNRTPPGNLHDTTTPQDLARDIDAITSGPVLDVTVRAKLNAWLDEVSTREPRLEAAIPGDWSIRHKTGTGRWGRAHEIGILTPPGSFPIVIAVMSDGPSQTDTPDDSVISQAARRALPLLLSDTSSLR